MTPSTAKGFLCLLLYLLLVSFSEAILPQQKKADRHASLRSVENLEEAARKTMSIDPTEMNLFLSPNTEASQSITETTTMQTPERRLQEGGDFSEYYKDLDVESLEEGMALGGALLLIMIVLCLLCCCCQMCCGGRGGGCSLWDMLAILCCYEMFCDDSPGCFIPMDDCALC